MVFFFKQKTAYEMRISDWSSDVCSSDLRSTPARSVASSPTMPAACAAARRKTPTTPSPASAWYWPMAPVRSEERRVGKECVDLGGRRIIKTQHNRERAETTKNHYTTNTHEHVAANTTTPNTNRDP